MSLQLAAQHIASKGRGPDTALVHMAPSEVKTLQAVARAHGGTLTINPDTGLPEAGFLSSILPMIAGVGLTALSGGTLSPVMAGLLTGGGTALATGNLQKGLMAGLGAYGGAGLGAGLAGAGAQEAILQANPGLTAGEIAREMGTPGFVQPSVTDKMMAGFKGLGNEAGRDAFMQNVGGAKGLFKSGYSAALPVLMAQSGQSPRPPSSSVGTPYSSEYVPGYTGAGPNMDSSEVRFMNPRYVSRMADGGDTGMTGQSDAYYRYLMGLAPAPTFATYAPPASYVPGGSSAASVSEALAPSAQLMAGNRTRYYDPYADGGEGPTPPNIGNAFNSQGMPNAVTSALISAANAMNITSPQQGAIHGLPGLLMGSPLGILAGAILGNAAQIGQMTGFSNIAEGNSNAGAVPGGEALQMSQGAHSEGQVDTGPVDVGGPTGAGVPGSEAANVAEGMSSVAEGAVDSGPAASDADAPGDKRGGLIHRRAGGISAAYAQGGYNLGDYSDGGRLLKGPGDGVSDSIPASIADKRPARLADGEFVVPARIVSELGNGSTDAGARRLYAMMDRIQQNRSKTTGKGKVAVNSRSEKYLPA